MKKSVEKPVFEFSLFINNNIICQRSFDIYGFNEECLGSYELKDMMNEISGVNNELGRLGIIPKFLKRKSDEYLWENYNPYKTQKEEDIFIQDIFERDDNFQFEVKMGNKLIASSNFSGNLFPPKVRYQVNIREIISDIISEIRDYLTKTEYTSINSVYPLTSLN